MQSFIVVASLVLNVTKKHLSPLRVKAEQQSSLKLIASYLVTFLQSVQKNVVKF